jgi:hypothetical protein
MTCRIPSMLDLLSLSSQVSENVRPDVFGFQCYPVRILQAPRACRPRPAPQNVSLHSHSHTDTIHPAPASSPPTHHHSTSRSLPTTSPVDPYRTPVRPNKASPTGPDDVSRPNCRGGLSVEIPSGGLSASPTQGRRMSG